jgi:uncharacterized protein (TIGR02246 family)
VKTDEEDIRELIATWISASRDGDTERILSLMSEDVVFLMSGQPPMRGRSVFAASQRALGGFEIDGKSEVQEIKVMGDWAYTWTQLTVVITPVSGGDSIKRTGNTLSILQKQNGNWVITRDANMLAVVPN